MKLYKNGFIILLIICLVGAVAFYIVRHHTQAKLNEKIISSLELNQEAVELFAGGEFAEARELLSESLSLNRLNPKTYVYLAFVELNLDNPKGAYEHFVSGLNMEATSVDMIKNLADILIKNGYYAEAQGHLKHGLKDYPGNEELIFLLGKVDLLSGNFKGSLDAFKQLSGENTDADIYKYLGLASYYSGDKESAADYYLEYLTHRGLLQEEEEPDAEFLHEKVLEIWGEQNG